MIQRFCVMCVRIYMCIWCKVKFVLRYFYADIQGRGSIASTHSQSQHWKGVLGQYRHENPINTCIFTYWMEIKAHKPLC